MAGSIGSGPDQLFRFFFFFHLSPLEAMTALPGIDSLKEKFAP